MQSLQVLSLVRTRQEHEALAAVLGSLTMLTTLKLAWCASSPSVCAPCDSTSSLPGYYMVCNPMPLCMRSATALWGLLDSVHILAEAASSRSHTLTLTAAWVDLGCM